MSQPFRNEPRDIGSPVSFYDYQRPTDLDFTPRVVNSKEVLPDEEVVGGPKVKANFYAPESVSNSDLIPEAEDFTAPVEKDGPAQLRLEEEPIGTPSPDSFPASPKVTSAGDVKPPVVTPPSPPTMTPSSPAVVK